MNELGIMVAVAILFGGIGGIIFGVLIYCSTLTPIKNFKLWYNNRSAFLSDTDKRRKKK